MRRSERTRTGILPQMTGSLARSLDRIGACGVLPVVELPDGTDPIALVDALLGARIDAIEITLRSAGAIDAMSGGPVRPT